MQQSQAKRKQFSGKNLIRFTASVFFGLFAIILLVLYLFVGYKLNDENLVNKLALGPRIGTDESYNSASVAGAHKQLLRIDGADGATLDAWLFKVDGSDKLTIVNHGNAGWIAGRVYIADVLVRAGTSVLMYDYRGYGKSSGKATLRGILDDGITVYEYARDKLSYPPNKIILYGESIGSAVACNVACHRSCAGAILQSGIASLPIVARSLIPVLWIYPDFVFGGPHLENVERVRDIHVPILFIHGKIDRIVPSQNSNLMYANANEPKELVFLPNCGHNDMGVQDTKIFRETIARFINRVVFCDSPR